MKFANLATSLAALALFASPGLAAGLLPEAPAPIVVAAANAILPTVVRVLLSDQRAAGDLSDEELGQRLGKARRFMALDQLSPDVRQALRDMAAGDEAELARRQGGDAGNDQAGSGQDAQPSDTVLPIGTEVPDDVLAYIGDGRAPAELSADELKSRIAQGRKILAIEGLSRDARSKVMQRLAADRAAMAGGSAAQPAEESGAAQDVAQGGAPDANLPMIAALDKYFAMNKPVKSMSLAELKTKYGLGQKLLSYPDLPSNLRARVEQSQAATAAELRARSGAAGGDDGEQMQADGQSTAAGKSPADAKAMAILQDKTSAQTMKVEALQARVLGIRRLLQNKNLSPGIKQALRAKLENDRTVLRSRMAQLDNIPQDPTPGEITAGGGTQAGGMIHNVIGDRRPPEQLTDDELKLRINILVNIAGDNRYSDFERSDWRRRLDRDRFQLRQRMLRERAQRQARLRQQHETIILDRQPAPQDDLAAAEFDDQSLQDALVAAPRRKFDRRYSVQDFETRPELREAVPRIEIDTIHFGFNEGFVREEEIGNLDRVAEIMERILAAHPDEVFMIEGHTDASGSDAYNLGLSRQRAEAVMEALTTYYVIPPDNLRTVGYGERYLKIPVDGPEAENRRVSISRITEVIGGY